MTDAFLVTCEHAGNAIPKAYLGLFRGQASLLNSHRGYDVGALAVARSLAAALEAPLLTSRISRLLVDLNRPPGHPRLFSSLTRDTAPEIRADIARRHHQPHWSKVRDAVHQAVTRGHRVVHVSSHSFTPVLNGQVRQADVGLLYDPHRPGEAGLCARWKAALTGLAPDLRVRRNYPYRGNAPGLTTQMRRWFPAQAYLGIELEVSQSLAIAAGPRWLWLRRLLPRALIAACTTPHNVRPF